MSHVAEGELHAWLDGALDQLGEKRAEQVREHLRRCDACQVRLAAEEALRAQAIEVLAMATPRTSELPPLESLMERARSAAAAGASVRSRMSRAARLGWAASVVLALGAGWMARELGLHGPVEPPGIRQAEAPAPAAPAAQPAVSADAVAAPPAEENVGALAAGPRDAAAEPAPVRRTLADAPRAVADPTAGAALDRVATEVAESAAKLESSAPANVVAAAPPPEVFVPPPARETPVAGVGAAAPEPPPTARTGSAEVANSAAQRAAASGPSVAEGSVAGERAANAPARSATGRQERAASSAVPETAAGAIGIQRSRTESSGVPNLFVAGRARGANDQQERTRAPVITTEADTSEAKGLIVPGLEVLRVEWTEVVPGQRGIQVLQRLQSGDTLEIRFVRSGGAAADAANDPLTAILNAELSEGWNQAVLPQRDGWIVARAPLPERELRELLNGVGESRR
jgi:hypothetical protein